MTLRSESAESRWFSLVELFSSAALGGDWPAALRMFAESCGAERGQIIGLGADRAVPFNWINDAPRQSFEQIEVVGGHDPSRNPRVGMGLKSPLLKAWHDLDCFDPVTAERYPEVCQHFIRYEIPHGSQATLMRDSEILLGVATLRSAARGIPGEEERRAFEAMLPHIRDAVRLQMTLEGQGAALMAGALEAVGAAAFILDGHGHVGAATAAAEATLSDGLLRVKGRRLIAGLQSDARPLEAAISHALIGRTSPRDTPARAVVLRRAGMPFEPVIADVMSLPAREHAFGFQPRVLVTLRGLSRSDTALAGHLRTAFGLTQAEAEIALRLADGDSREAIARDRGAALATVRTQVKKVFSKVGVRQTAEFVAKIGRFR